MIDPKSTSNINVHIPRPHLHLHISEWGMFQPFKTCLRFSDWHDPIKRTNQSHQIWKYKLGSFLTFNGLIISIWFWLSKLWVYTPGKPDGWIYFPNCFETNMIFTLFLIDFGALFCGCAYQWADLQANRLSKDYRLLHNTYHTN